MQVRVVVRRARLRIQGGCGAAWIAVGRSAASYGRAAVRAIRVCSRSGVPCVAGSDDGGRAGGQQGARVGDKGRTGNLQMGDICEARHLHACTTLQHIHKTKAPRSNLKVQVFQRSLEVFESIQSYSHQLTPIR